MYRHTKARCHPSNILPDPAKADDQKIFPVKLDGIGPYNNTVRFDAGITADRHPYVVVDHAPRRLTDLVAAGRCGVVGRVTSL